VLTGCGTAPAAEGGFVSGDGSITRIAPGQREPAPVLAGTDLDGDPLDSSAFAGTIVVYNVWGSWCAPCRAEAGALVKAAARTDGTAQFIGINTRDLDPGPARAFVRTHDIGFPSFYDPRGELLLLFGGVLSPSAIPTTLVVDAEGRMAARVLGEVSEATLVGLITEISEGR
jgi:thiol-disulfide isomerase/thioredoxin